MPNIQMQSMKTDDTKTREFLNYSKQCAYKALKHMMLEKNLNFKPEIWEEMSEVSRASTDRSIVDTDDKSDVAESESPESGTHSPESSPFFREMQRRLRKTWAANIEKQSIQYKLFRSSSNRSSMIPAKSLARSSFSTKFARYETRESRSANILSAIPKVSCFQRRNRDRCLSCMHKSLRKTDATDKAVSSQTILLTEIEARDDSESSSGELPEFREELQKMYLQKKNIPRNLEKIETASDKSASSSYQAEQEDISTPKAESNQSKNKTAKPAESLLSKSPKSLKATSISISISSEPSRISSSEVHTSDDETSSPLALNDDPTRYKNMAPCHLPTVLLPSMEPLWALRHRKPTTMESRIALMESTITTKEKSDEEYYDDAKTAVSKTSTEKLQSRPVGEKPERLGEEKDISLKSPRTLLKVKSEQQLIPPIVKSAPKDKLKRGYSCASIEDLSKDSARGTFNISRGEAEDGRGEVISFAKEPSFSDSGRRTELPLSTVAEISQFLDKTNRRDASAAIMLESLADEFISRLIKHQEHADTTATMRRVKLTARLTKLLADSKRYLSPDKFPSHLIFSAQQPPACNSRLLRRVLPLDSYNLVAPLLGMPIWYPKRKKKEKVAVHYEEEREEEEEEEEIEGAIPFDLVVCQEIL